VHGVVMRLLVDDVHRGSLRGHRGRRRRRRRSGARRWQKCRRPRYHHAGVDELRVLHLLLLQLLLLLLLLTGTWRLLLLLLLLLLDQLGTRLLMMGHVGVSGLEHGCASGGGGRAALPLHIAVVLVVFFSARRAPLYTPRRLDG
jgi:hypothetical protein